MDIARRYSGISQAIAQVLLWGFNKHYRLFRETAHGARERFEKADWKSVQQASRDRILFYDQRVQETIERLEREFQTARLPDAVWQQVKFDYIDLLIDHKQPELAETFFNTVCCKILHRTYYNNTYIFVRPTISTEHLDSDPPAYRCYYPGQDGLLPVFRQILQDSGLTLPFDDLERDLDLLMEVMQRQLPEPFVPRPNHQVQILRSLFFRNKMCYAIGKIVNGYAELPFAIAIRHTREKKLAIDTIVFESMYLHWLFSYARSYFMVDTEVPAAYVQFLQTIVPGRTKAELYTIIGLQKHGKALFYRDYLHHMKHSGDQFDIAPGIKGLVMLVFAVPSFPFVFKVIRDVIGRPKDIDREGVKAKYLMVKLHDRVGRMADTLEYSDVAFPKARFTQELIDEIKAFAPSVYLEEGDTIIIRHLYIERRMIPLNIHLQDASDEEIEHTINDYGLAIKQLAAANIFPGDMLYKNFGLTRHRRVVFYDYDEIEYMTNCNFRKIPTAHNEEEVMSSEPWYPVAKNDIFPEEWQTFLLGDPRIRAAMLRRHPEIFDYQYWQRLKDRLIAGHFEDVFPYPDEIRFKQVG